MIEIRLYGKLRDAALNASIQKGVIRLQPWPQATVATLLETLGFAGDEIYTIFLNHRLLATRSNLARWMGYQMACPDPLDWNLQVPVKAGDRIGLFGRDMAALIV
jgi:hypothetical protein